MSTIDAPYAHARMRTGISSFHFTLLAITVVGLASLWLRPLLPVDETRYLAVAWEMWWRGDFVLPWLNGEPYHHKPPLLFWLIHVGWAVFGVNEVWPRLISPLSALLAALAIRSLARELWPHRGNVVELAPMLAFGSLYLLAWQSALMFDTLLLALLVSAWTQLHRLMLRPSKRSAALFFAFSALALLCKGPVALVHLLGPLLTWPWWRPTQNDGLRRLALPLVILALAALPLLAWALEAGSRGGEAFRQALLFGQTLDRIKGAMGHPRPWWFYLPLLLLLPLPWSAWPRAWQVLPKIPELLSDASARFVIATLAVASLLHLGVAGKQAHYLIPMLVLAFVLLARLLDGQPGSLAAANRIALGGAGLLTLLVAIGGPLATPRYPLSAIGHALAEAEQRSRPIAYIGNYQGEFHFGGRLRVPIAEVSPALALTWARQHPTGLLFARSKRLAGDLASYGEARFKYKGSDLWLLPARAFIDRAVQAQVPPKKRGLQLGID